MNKKGKKTFIILVYAVILVGLIYLIFSVFKSEPSCNDGLLNQGERGIDCGGPCQSCEKEIKAEKVEIKEKAFVYGGPEKFDVVVKIYNPNHNYGGSRLNYEFKLIGEGGEELAVKKGTGFILPRETKYFIETNMESSIEPKYVDVNISNVKWEEFSGYEEPILGIYNKQFNQASGASIYNEVYGLLRNESYFDYNAVYINVILRDANGNPVALNRNEMNTVNSQEERDFRLIWPFNFKEEIASVEIEAEANVYDSENFIKRYLPAGKFQEYQIK